MTMQFIMKSLAASVFDFSQVTNTQVIELLSDSNLIHLKNKRLLSELVEISILNKIDIKELELVLKEVFVTLNSKTSMNPKEVLSRSDVDLINGFIFYKSLYFVLINKLMEIHMNTTENVNLRKWIDSKLKYFSK